MKNETKKLKDFFLDILFPKFCVGCNCEGDYLCPDCRGLIDINYYQFCPVCNQKSVDGRTCPKCRNKTKLNGLFWAVPYQNPLVKKLFSRFKYESRVKDISKILAGFVIDSFEIMPSALPGTPSRGSPGGRPGETNKEKWVLIPVPLSKKKLKRRGFNQAEEIAKHLANSWKIPLISDVLIKSRETTSQTNLDKEERKENVREAFRLREPTSFVQMRKEGGGIIQNKKILLLDDIYTTGATMNECAQALKQAGASQVWGIAVARE